MLFKTVLERQVDFERMLNESEKSKETTRHYLLAVRKFVDFARENGCCDRIDKRCVILHKENLMCNYAPTTSNLYINGLNSYFKFLGEENLCVKTLRIQGNFSFDNGLELKEYDNMLRAARGCRNPSYYAIKTIACTGIRVGELEYITVEAVRNGGCTVLNKGKVRQIRITDSLSEELSNFCHSNNITEGYVFHGADPEKPLSPRTIRRWVKKAAVQGEVDTKKGHPHNLRHLFAVRYMEKNKDLPALSNLLGHDDLSTTAIYTQQTENNIRQSMGGLGL